MTGPDMSVFFLRNSGDGVVKAIKKFNFTPHSSTRGAPRGKIPVPKPMRFVRSYGVVPFALRGAAFEFPLNICLGGSKLAKFNTLRALMVGSIVNDSGARRHTRFGWSGKVRRRSTVFKAPKPTCPGGADFTSPDSLHRRAELSRSPRTIHRSRGKPRDQQRLLLCPVFQWDALRSFPDEPRLGCWLGQ